MYKEHEKISKHKDMIMNVLEFLEYASENGVALMKYNEESAALRAKSPGWYSVEVVFDRIDGTKLLYEMLELDEKKLEAERRTMLEEIRRA